MHKQIQYKKKGTACWSVYFYGIICLLILAGCEGKGRLLISGAESNDLVVLMKQQKGLEVICYPTPMEAVEVAREGDGLLILADAYPEIQTEVNDQFFERLKEKKVKAFIEYPSLLPGMTLGQVGKAQHERAVVNSGYFQGMPDSLEILGINGLHYIPVDASGLKNHIVAARVAGFDQAIFGLLATRLPVLFELPGGQVLVATTNFSRFVSGRYAPAEEWAGVWAGIIRFVLPGVQLDDIRWTPIVGTSYAKEETLPDGYQKESVKRGVEWYKNARMLAPASYRDTVQQLVDADIQRLHWHADIPVGDGSEGLFECIFSEIDENGRQPIGLVKRGDCISEASMAFATAGSLLGDEEYKKTAERLLDFYLFQSPALKKEYGDPKHPAYGLIPWGITNYAWYKASYGDDNARFLLASWTTAALVGTDRWDDILMRSLLALLRTTGKNGFRGDRIDLPDLEKNGWQYYNNREIINPTPHFESYLWACYLWAYDKTGDRVFKDRAVEGIKNMMAKYPDGWNWTNGLAQERARIILPLAWLVRVDDTPENRSMLTTAVTDFLQLQDECGAIREELGEIKMGRYPPPQSNEAYGTTEASLIAKNGDPVSDLLYTTNFAFLGLHEAAYATGDKQIKEASDRLADFLCRIQVRSAGHPELDGGWMRAFDYSRFEHWGSNADLGWGAWAIETGWTQGWITAILALREMDRSVWDLTGQSTVAKHYKELKEEMYPKSE